MRESFSLIDTPKKKFLQAQADTLRVALKEYERVFAAEHQDRKPSRDEIKANKVIAAQYQQYQTVRDVLAGKRGLEALKTPKRQQTVGKRHERTDSAISLTPHRIHGLSPSKIRSHPNDIDPYDPPSSFSPKVYPNAIGPTPRRDGTVLGIFDLLSHSGSRKSSQATPSSKKRKANALYENEGEAAVAQTPSQRRRQSTDNETHTHLAVTPQSGLATGRRNHSKTPISESKKFMLNHFFATPSAVRFAGVIGDDKEKNTPMQSKTPLRDMVLGISPAKELHERVQSSTNVDATPPYLKRSFSFKERLLSAFEETKSTPTSARRSLSGSLRHARFVPKPLSQIISDREQAQVQEKYEPLQHQADEDEDEDELDALREMEANEVNVLVEDSQILDDHTIQTLNTAEPGDSRQPTRVWKKKGQKRTTRRVIMRPLKTQPDTVRKPKVVTKEQDEDEQQEVDDEVDEDDNNASHVENTQLLDTAASGDAEFDDSDYDEALDTCFKEVDDDPDEDAFQPTNSPAKKPAPKSKPKSKSKSNSTTGTSTTDPKPRLGKPSKSHKPAQGEGEHDAESGGGRKINPNAHSHMNFRSLKIKNKNSKAKGRGRFGRGRR